MKKRNIYKYGDSSKKRLETTSDYLQLTAEKAIICSPIDFGVPWMGGKRLNTEQREIFNAGNSKADGFDKLSYHQKLDEKGLGQALDLVPYINGIGFDYTAFGRFGIIGMLMLEAWEELQEAGAIPKGLYLHWGGFWSNKKKSNLGWDLAHYEIRDYPQKINLK